MTFAKIMHLSKLVTALFFLLISHIYGEYHLTESVVFDISRADKKLPNDKVSLLLVAKKSEGRSIIFGDMVVKVSWSKSKGRCESVNSLGRLLLNEYKSQKESSSKKFFSNKDQLISSSNAEKLANKYTLILYHFKEQDKDGLHNTVIVDVFGDSVVGTIKFVWKDTIHSDHALTVCKIVDSIKVSQAK